MLFSQSFSPFYLTLDFAMQKLQIPLLAALLFFLLACAPKTAEQEGQNQEPQTETAQQASSSETESQEPALSTELEKLISTYGKVESIDRFLYAERKSLKKTDKGLLGKIIKAAACDLLEANYAIGQFFQVDSELYLLPLHAEGGEEDMTPAGPPSCLHLALISAQGQVLDVFLAEYGLDGAAQTQSRSSTILSINEQGQLQRMVEDVETSYYDNYIRGKSATSVWLGNKWKQIAEKEIDEKFMDEED